MIPSYPKIFQLGDRHILDLFEGPVQITEKVDGSQYGFGKVNGEVKHRSKGAQLVLGHVQQLFTQAVEYIESIKDILPEGVKFYGEVICRPKHNVLQYNTVPKNHIALYAALNADGSAVPPEQVMNYATILGIDHVPVLFTGVVPSSSYEDLLMFLKGILERESYLGGPKIEGVVVKNFTKEFELMGIIHPFKQGKYVSEAFKEVHQKSWTKENTGRGRWEDYKLGFKTEARKLKAVQHLRDAGLLQFEPKDIGLIVKEIARDVAEEEKENIKEYLWNEFGKDCIRTAQQGAAEWYKEYLVKSQSDRT